MRLEKRRGGYERNMDLSLEPSLTSPPPPSQPPAPANRQKDEWEAARSRTEHYLSSLRATPDRRPIPMTPHPLEFGWGAKLARYAERPQFKNLALWLMIAIALGL